MAYYGVVQNNHSRGIWQPLRADNLFKAKVEMTQRFRVSKEFEDDKFIIAKITKGGEVKKLCMRNRKDKTNSWRILE
jgi:hypothetical protein